MSKLLEFFDRKRDVRGVDKDSAHANEKRDNGDGEHFGYESQSEIDLRIGKEHEALHNLLVDTEILADTERRIGELAGLKDAFGKIIVSFTKTLRALEQEKSQNASLKDTLDKNRGAYETLRTKLYEVERKATAFEAENERLKEDLAARELARGLENNRTELTQDGSYFIGKFGNEIALILIGLGAVVAQLQRVAETLPARPDPRAGRPFEPQIPAGNEIALILIGLGAVVAQLQGVADALPARPDPRAGRPFKPQMPAGREPHPARAERLSHPPDQVSDHEVVMYRRQAFQFDRR